MSVWRVKKKLGLWLSAASLLCATAMPVAAGDGSGAWEFNAQIYLWGAGVSGETVAGDDIEMGFSKILENLDMALMGSLAAQKDDWILLADAIYMNLSNDTKSTANILNHPVKTELDVDLKAFITTLAGGHSVFRNDATNIDLLVGARYLKLKTTLKAQVGPIQRKVSGSGSIWDGIIGVRGQTDLSEKWYLNYYADVGTGGSKRTWQALASVGYRFSKVDAVFGYRYLDWSFDGKSDVFDDLSISGPFAGVRWSF